MGLDGLGLGGLCGVRWIMGLGGLCGVMWLSGLCVVRWVVCG